MNTRKVTASIMCANFLRLPDTVAILNDTAYDYMHFDVMDGSFYPDYLLGKKLIQDIQSVSTLTNDFHLMIRRPGRFIENLMVDADDVMTVHVELCDDVAAVLEQIKRKGCRVGLAIDAPTEADVLDRYYKDVDIILVMLVNAGQRGNIFQPHTFEKIKRIRERIDRSGQKIMIEADGSVNANTVPKLKKLGVNIYVGGSTGLFREDVSFQRAAQEFKQLVQS